MSTKEELEAIAAEALALLKREVEMKIEYPSSLRLARANLIEKLRKLGESNEGQ